MLCFPKDVDKATSSRIALEKQLEQLEVELEFLKRVHQQVKTSSFHTHLSPERHAVYAQEIGE